MQSGFVNNVLFPDHVYWLPDRYVWIQLFNWLISKPDIFRRLVGKLSLDQRFQRASRQLKVNYPQNAMSKSYNGMTLFAYVAWKSESCFNVLCKDFSPDQAIQLMQDQLIPDDVVIRQCQWKLTINFRQYTNS